MNIIVTGASRGIGYEIVKHFALQGNNLIYALSRNIEKLDVLKNDCFKLNPKAKIIPVGLDIAESQQLNQFTSQLKDTIDILINNAGYLTAKPFEKLLEDDVQQMYQVNVIKPLLLIQQLLPNLKEAKLAHVVNISSMGGFQGSAKFPGLAPYASSKAAIACLTECLAEEFKGTNIKFNCLALGAVATEMLAEAFPDYKAPTTAKEMAQFICEFAITGSKMFNGKILPVSISTP